MRILQYTEGIKIWEFQAVSNEPEEKEAVKNKCPGGQSDWLQDEKSKTGLT